MMSYYDRIRTKLISTIIVDDKTDCWLWQGANSLGYGQLQFNGSVVGAHRVSWTIFIGPIPDGLSVLHKCDIKNCINPHHLFIGTNVDNSLDAMAKGICGNQVRTHCKHGHEFTPDNTATYITQSGKRRRCKTCDRARYIERRS